MRTVIVAIDEPRASALAAELQRDGIRVVAVVPPTEAPHAPLDHADAVIVRAARGALSAALVAACDRAGVRIVALGAGDTRLAGRFGLPEPLPEDAESWQIADALAADQPARARAAAGNPSRIIAVWGPHGSPGRSTVAIQLAVELARTGRATALVDADTVAPALALLLGLDDDAPGLAAACRRAELGGLDAAELSRIATPLDTSAGTVAVLGGLNRPARWPELSAHRLRATLTACRDWVEWTVVDVAAAFDEDEDLVDDLAGPRRHAATTTVLRNADAVIAVTSADPLSVSRFLRDHAELRRLVDGTPVTVVANRVRPGPLGIDARGQIRRTLDRFAGIDDVEFLPFDQRAADAALLHARPMADLTPRSPFVAGVRRVAGVLGGAATAPPATAGSLRGSSRAVRWPRSARVARAGSRRAGDPASAS